MLAQLWSETPYLSPDERRQMADFIALRLTSSLPANVEHRLSAHFVPR